MVHFATQRLLKVKNVQEHNCKHGNVTLCTSNIAHTHTHLQTNKQTHLKTNTHTPKNKNKHRGREKLKKGREHLYIWKFVERVVRG